LLLAKAKTDYYCFLKYINDANDLTWNWHHKYICSILQEKFLFGDVSNLMIFMPPQHQKTTMMVDFFIPWLFGKNNDAQCLLVMYNSTFASKHNRKVQKIMMDPKYIQLFGSLIGGKILSDYKESRTMNEFEIKNSNGFLKSAGIGGGIAGTPAKFTFMDDVIKNAAEANSKKFRDNIYDWFTDEVEARQHNDSKIAFTITRRHEDDLAGRILKRDGKIEDGGKWTVISLPALKEDNSNPDDPREIGEALFEKLHSRKRMEEKQLKTPSTFLGLYQQRPFKLEGNIIKKDQFNIVDEFSLPVEAFEFINFTVDTAYTKETNNDPSGILSYFVYKGNLFVTNWKKGHWEISALCKNIIEFVIQNGNNKSMVYIEPKASGKSAFQRIKEITLGTLNVIEYDMPAGDKLAKLNANQPFFESGRIFLLKGHWNEEFINEITGFPNMPNDEAVDCINMAITQGLERANIPPFDYSNGIGSA